MNNVKEQYLEWLLTPPGERVPVEKQEFAEQFGVARSTLWRWEQEPEFQEELRALKAKWGIQFHGEILARLFKIVQEGTDASAIQASKVLLNHIDVSGGDTGSEDVEITELKAIKKMLEDRGYVTSPDE